jgi:hypothetical protein
LSTYSSSTTCSQLFWLEHAGTSDFDPSSPGFFGGFVVEVTSGRLDGLALEARVLFGDGLWVREGEGFPELLREVLRERVLLLCLEGVGEVLFVREMLLEGEAVRELLKERVLLPVFDGVLEEVDEELAVCDGVIDWEEVGELLREAVLLEVVEGLVLPLTEEVGLPVSELEGVGGGPRS